MSVSWLEQFSHCSTEINRRDPNKISETWKRSMRNLFNSECTTELTPPRTSVRIKDQKLPPHFKNILQKTQGMFTDVEIELVEKYRVV